VREWWLSGSDLGHKRETLFGCPVGKIFRIRYPETEPEAIKIGHMGSLTSILEPNRIAFDYGMIEMALNPRGMIIPALAVANLFVKERQTES